MLTGRPAASQQAMAKLHFTCRGVCAVLCDHFVLLSAEVGDYCEELAAQEYLSSMKLLPNHSRPIEHQIIEHHKEHMYVLLAN